MDMISKLLTVLLLFTFLSVSLCNNLKAGPKPASAKKPKVNKTKKVDGLGYFHIRSEWDNRCLAVLKGKVALTKDCNLKESIWRGKPGKIQEINVQNYKTKQYLGFQPKKEAPVMTPAPAGKNSKWNFIVINKGNRRFPNDDSLRNVTYHIVKNIGTNLCLTIDGDSLRQLNCLPAKPEHLSFEEIPFNPEWGKKKVPAEADEEDEGPLKRHPSKIIVYPAYRVSKKKKIVRKRVCQNPTK